jgi:hypothetical protein
MLNALKNNISEAMIVISVEDPDPVGSETFFVGRLKSPDNDFPDL